MYGPHSIMVLLKPQPLRNCLPLQMCLHLQKCLPFLWLSSTWRKTGQFWKLDKGHLLQAAFLILSSSPQRTKPSLFCSPDAWSRWLTAHAWGCVSPLGSVLLWGRHHTFFSLWEGQRFVVEYTDLEAQLLRLTSWLWGWLWGLKKWQSLSASLLLSMKWT